MTRGSTARRRLGPRRTGDLPLDTSFERDRETAGPTTRHSGIPGLLRAAAARTGALLAHFSAIVSAS